MKRSRRALQEAHYPEKLRRERLLEAMRNLDTNVLVRYLVADDRGQLAAVESLIEDCRLDREQLFVSTLVLCELVWVLARSYRQTRTIIVQLLEQILERDQFRVEDDALVRRSLDAYSQGKGNFADYLIGEIGRRAGCRDTVTFDRDLRGADGFTVI
jgi:predicted nucleic-acid-binding protein